VGAASDIRILRDLVSVWFGAHNRDLVAFLDPCAGEKIRHRAPRAKNALRAVDVRLDRSPRNECNRDGARGGLGFIAAPNRILWKEVERHIKMVVAEIAAGDRDRSNRAR